MIGEFADTEMTQKQLGKSSEWTQNRFRIISEFFLSPICIRSESPMADLRYFEAFMRFSVSYCSGNKIYCVLFPRWFE